MSDFSPHRPQWVRWLPAVVLSILITAAVIVAVVYGPRWAEGPGPAQSGQVDDRNYSVFTEDGLEFIDAERIPRIDLTTVPIEAEALGLPRDGEFTVGPHPLGLDYRLVLLVNRDEAGGARFVSESFTLITESGELTEIRVTPSTSIAPGGLFREERAFIESQAERYGFTAPTFDETLELVIAAQEAGQPQTLLVGPGDAAGVSVGIELVCVGEGFCSSTFVVTPGVG